MEVPDPALIGAFFSGIGAALSAYISLRVSRKRSEADCVKRIEEVKQAMREGWEMGKP